MKWITGQAYVVICCTYCGAITSKPLSRLAEGVRMIVIHMSLWPAIARLVSHGRVAGTQGRDVAASESGSGDVPRPPSTIHHVAVKNMCGHLNAHEVESCHRREKLVVVNTSGLFDVEILEDLDKAQGKQNDAYNWFVQDSCKSWATDYHSASSVVSALFLPTRRRAHRASGNPHACDHSSQCCPYEALHLA